MECWLTVSSLQEQILIVLAATFLGSSTNYLRFITDTKLSHKHQFLYIPSSLRLTYARVLREAGPCFQSYPSRNGNKPLPLPLRLEVRDWWHNGPITFLICASHFFEHHQSSMNVVRSFVGSTGPSSGDVTVKLRDDSVTGLGFVLGIIHANFSDDADESVCGKEQAHTCMKSLEQWTSTIWFALSGDG
jgi:hypothetical protein